MEKIYVRKSLVTRKWVEIYVLLTDWDSNEHMSLANQKPETEKNTQ